MFAGVLDFLNNGGTAIIGVVVVLSLAYLFGSFTNEKDRCSASHPVKGRCRLARHHRPRYKHTNWRGDSWWD